MLFNGSLIKVGSVPLLNSDRILGTFAQTGAQTIAEGLADQTGLAVDYLDCPLDAGRHTESATIALFFVDPDYLSYRHWNSPALLYDCRLPAGVLLTDWI